jgi:two-component system NtrC family sensor kinase
LTSLTISQKILLGIVPAVLLFITGGVVLHNHFQERDMIKQAQTAAETYAHIIRESLVTMMVTNYEVDESFLSRVGSIRQIDSLRIVLNELRLRSDLLTAGRLERLRLKRSAHLARDSVDRIVIASGKTSFIRSGDSFRATVPFKAEQICQKCHDVPVHYALGAADIYISLQTISRSIDENWKRSFFIFVLFVISAIGVGTLAFRRFVARPVEALVQATKEISKGNLQQPAAVSRTRDELGELATAFEDMRRSLHSAMKEIEAVNSELVQKNASLRASLEALREAQAELIRAERLSAIGQMASSIIHDFKNPMTTVMAYAAWLKDQPDAPPERRNRAYEAMVRAVERMSEMTRDVLDFSRGRVPLNARTVSVAEFVEDVRDAVHLNLKAHNVEFEVRNSCDCRLQIDVDRFRRALINIINNAQEAMPHGGRIIFAVERRNESVEFRLSDTGTGIADEIRENIFDPFVTFGKVEGTGLGLAITKLIVEEHSGKVDVSSLSGVGTTFIVTIPLPGLT